MLNVKFGSETMIKLFVLLPIKTCKPATLKNEWLYVRGTRFVETASRDCKFTTSYFFGNFSVATFSQQPTFGFDLP